MARRSCRSRRGFEPWQSPVGISLFFLYIYAVFTLAINRLHSFKRQPFWFHSLNSMVPVKGIDLFY